MKYMAVDRWPRLPPGWTWTEAAAVAVDSRDRVFVFNRGPHPVAIFDRDGAFLDSWGDGLFKRPHGIFIGPDDAVYCTDDLDHTVRKFTPDGKLLMTMGTMNKPSDTGYDGKDTGTVSRAAGPFNRPTNLAVGPKGDLYISDGYGNCRVHQFSPRGELKRSWGTPGAATWWCGRWAIACGSRASQLTVLTNRSVLPRNSMKKLLANSALP